MSGTTSGSHHLSGGFSSANRGMWYDSNQLVEALSGRGPIITQSFSLTGNTFRVQSSGDGKGDSDELPGVQRDVCAGPVGRCRGSGLLGGGWMAMWVVDKP